jgi:V/A-type H+-transporting ATPase subunit I
VAIVKMNKISIIGLDGVKSSLIKELMDLGVMEITSLDYRLHDKDWIGYTERDGNENDILKYDSKLSKLNLVLESLDKYDKTKKPMFAVRKSISKNEFESVLQNEHVINNKVEDILRLNSSLSDLSSQENKIELNKISLKPWVDYKIPLNLNETKFTSILTGVIPNMVNISKLQEDIENKTNKYFIDVIGSDSDQYYLSIICLKNEKDDVYEILKQYSFNAVIFKELQGTASENILNFENELSEIAEKKSKIEEEISACINHKSEIQYLYDYTIMERDKSKILRNILKTSKTFYINGWIPEKCKTNVENVLKVNECWYEIVEPEQDEQYPILLNNNSYTQPFESITELYSLPSSSNIDPTAIMAPFYFMFFGLMLADVGYGLIMSLACFLVLRKFKIEGTMQKMTKMFFWCGLSTAFWGAMFGSWFGDAIPAAANLFFNSDFTIKPLWLNPMTEPMTVLIFSFIFGIVHLFVGMGISAYMLVRDGKPLAAITDIGFWYGFIIGIALWLFGNSILPGSTPIGKWMTIIFALGLVLTQGREKKGIINKLVSGVLSLYNITSYLSDILSYSRLLALGLASGVVSSVLSILGTMGGDGIFGAILFTIVMIVGHTFNFAINALGSFVHAARLQYVEFFGKFYEGGGEYFNPLMKKTKYIKIIREEN